MQPTVISSPPKPGSQYELASQEKILSQTEEMVTLSVPGVLSRSRSQPPAGSQSPDRSPLQLPESMSLSELPHTMAQQPLDPIESQFELLSPGGLIMMKYSVLYLKHNYYLLHDTIVATKSICTHVTKTMHVHVHI